MENQGSPISSILKSQYLRKVIFEQVKVVNRIKAFSSFDTFIQGHAIASKDSLREMIKYKWNTVFEARLKEIIIHSEYYKEKENYNNAPPNNKYMLNIKEISILVASLLEASIVYGNIVSATILEEYYQDIYLKYKKQKIDIRVLSYTLLNDKFKNVYRTPFNIKCIDLYYRLCPNHDVVTSKVVEMVCMYSSIHEAIAFLLQHAPEGNKRGEHINQVPFNQSRYQEYIQDREGTLQLFRILYHGKWFNGELWYTTILSLPLCQLDWVEYWCSVTVYMSDPPRKKIEIGKQIDRGLEYAARNPNIDILKYLIEKRLNYNQSKDQFDYTAILNNNNIIQSSMVLHYALESNHVENVDYVLQLMEESVLTKVQFIHNVNDSLNTLEMMKRMINAIHPQRIQPLLISAISTGSLEMVKLFDTLHHPKNDIKYNQVLHEALKYGSEMIINYLIDQHPIITSSTEFNINSITGMDNLILAESFIKNPKINLKVKFLNLGEDLHHDLEKMYELTYLLHKYRRIVCPPGTNVSIKVSPLHENWELNHIKLLYDILNNNNNGPTRITCNLFKLGKVCNRPDITCFLLDSLDNSRVELVDLISFLEHGDLESFDMIVNTLDIKVDGNKLFHEMKNIKMTTIEQLKKRYKIDFTRSPSGNILSENIMDGEIEIAVLQFITESILKYRDDQGNISKIDFIEELIRGMESANIVVRLDIFNYLFDTMLHHPQFKESPPPIESIKELVSRLMSSVNQETQKMLIKIIQEIPYNLNWGIKNLINLNQFELVKLIFEKKYIIESPQDEELLLSLEKGHLGLINLFCNIKYPLYFYILK